MSITPAQAVPLAAAAYLLAACLVLGSRKDGYSHWAHTISELGESGARDERLAALGLFLPVGAMLLAGAWLAWGNEPMRGALAACIAAGYLGAAFFPCDPGSPASGSWRQALHNLAGGFEYLGGGMALLAMAHRHGWMFQAAGAAVIGIGILIGQLPSKQWRGALQRAAECCLFGGLVIP